MNGLRSIAIVILFFISASLVHAQATQKEWTFLVYINGHNDLSMFSDQNIIDMERVGSTSDINIVVEWGMRKALAYDQWGIPTSWSYPTKRLYVQKSKDPLFVTSPTLQSFDNMDMGDYRNFQKFIEWGMKAYPAKHYFVAIWNHGSGWHKTKAKMGSDANLLDVSFDDGTKNFISTEQMGVVMANIKNTLGRNIDILGSDACLMQMLEIVGEFKDSVDYAVGSQELEPGEGWPYFPFLQKWAANPKLTPAEVSVLLSKEYDAAYDGGIYGTRKGTTFSALDLSKTDALYTAIASLTKSLVTLNAADMKKIKTAALSTTHFNSMDSFDYADLSDFMTQIRFAKISSIKSNLLNDVQARVKDLVLTTDNDINEFPNATGLSIWLPLTKNTHQARYDKLKSSLATGWNKFTAKLAPSSTGTSTSSVVH